MKPTQRRRETPAHFRYGEFKTHVARDMRTVRCFGCGKKNVTVGSHVADEQLEAARIYCGKCAELRRAALAGYPTVRIR